jgi:hypothetical protein
MKRIGLSGYGEVISAADTGTTANEKQAAKIE